MHSNNKKKDKTLVKVIVEQGAAARPAIKLLKPVNSPVLGYTFGFGRDSFVPAEYDLSEIGRIEDVENMVRQAFKKKTGLMFKEGYDFVGPNNKTVQYIKKRLSQIQEASGVPTQTLMRSIGSDLIRLSNAFLLKARNEKSSGGRVRRDANGRTLKPVAGYFILPAETIEVKKNKETGKIEKYRQSMPDGRTKEYSPEDVVHFYYDRRPGFNTGKPTIIPVIDDIRALRRIEQNIELLIYQHLFPLFHHKVGTKEQPDRTYNDGEKEVDLVRDEIEMMPSEGSIVTSYRHEITAIGAESRAIKAEGYIEHFKKRVIAGLGISSVDLGEGDTANRSTSETMSGAMIDEVKDFQQTIVTFFNTTVLRELLLEGDFNFDTLDEKNTVYLTFNEIDIDSKIKRENHNMLQYQGHTISETELRNAIGRESIADSEREGMYFDVITKPTLKYTADVAPKPQSLIGSGASNAAKAKQQPSNQHGTKSGPEKKKSSFIPKLAMSDGVLREEFKDLISDLEQSELTGTFSIDWAIQLLSMIETRMVDRLQGFMGKSMRLGIKSVTKPYEVEMSSGYKQIEGFANYRVRNIINIVKKIVRNFEAQDNTLDNVQKMYKSLAFRFDFILRTEQRRAFLYGKAIGLRNNGQSTVSVQVENGACEDCKRQDDNKIQLAHIRLDDMPIAHDNCQCDIV